MCNKLYSKKFVKLFKDIHIDSKNIQIQFYLEKLKEWNLTWQKLSTTVL